MWLAEINSVPIASAVPKYELHQYFDTYREDFNTATLPHIKYYDYDSWEMQEYQNNKLKQPNANHTTRATDEDQHRRQRRQLEQQQQQLATASVRVKRADMERQAQLQVQMQVAFRTGDQGTYRRLKAQLEPSE